MVQKMMQVPIVNYAPYLRKNVLNMKMNNRQKLYNKKRLEGNQYILNPNVKRLFANRVYNAFVRSNSPNKRAMINYFIKEFKKASNIKNSSQRAYAEKLVLNTKNVNNVRTKINLETKAAWGNNKVKNKNAVMKLKNKIKMTLSANNNEWAL